MFNHLVRQLNREVTIGGAIEVLIWLVLPYVLIGVIVTFFHTAYVDALADQFEVWLPAGAEVAAFCQITLMWPGLLLTGDLCMQ